jgi:hypothetical protein
MMQTTDKQRESVMSDINSKQPTRLYPRPARAKGLKSALAKLTPYLRLAQQHLAALPLRPMGENGELVRIATAKEMMNILSNTCHRRLIIDTQLSSLSGEAVVVATAYVLTDESGYQPVRSATASERYGVYAGKEIMSAQNRAIRLVLRGFGLRANDDDLLTREDKGPVQKKTEAQTTSSPAAKGKATVTDAKADAKKATPEEKTPRKATTSKTASATTKAAEKKATVKKSPAAKKTAASSKPQASSVDKATKKVAVDEPETADALVMPDHNSVTFRDDLVKGLNTIFAQKPKSLKKTVFIQSVLGKDAPNRLEMQSVPNLIKLFEHYTSSSDDAL